MGREGLRGGEGGGRGEGVRRGTHCGLHACSCHSLQVNLMNIDGRTKIPSGSGVLHLLTTSSE